MPGLNDINGKLGDFISRLGVSHDLQALISGSHNVAGSTINVRVEGLKELDDALSKFPEKFAEKALVQAITEATEAFRQRAIELAPYDSAERGKEGMHLQDGIKKQIRHGSHSVKGSWVHGKIALAKEVWYGRLIEFGWMAKGVTHVPARPFMRPAFDGEKYRALAIVSQRLEAAVDSTAREVRRK